MRKEKNGKQVYDKSFKKANHFKVDLYKECKNEVYIYSVVNYRMLISF